MDWNTQNYTVVAGVAVVNNSAWEFDVVEVALVLEPHSCHYGSIAAAAAAAAARKKAGC